MYPRSLPLATGLALLFSGQAGAEQNLEAVTVTATRQESRISDVLADVTVIDREEIQRAAGGTLADLLSRQAGIQVSSSGGAGSSTSFYVRGARPDQTKVLVDGLPINSLDLSGSPLRYLSLANVERIEILRGPGSTMYGADAIGGVIQIFTRKGTPGARADAFAGFGSRDNFQSQAGFSGGDEHWRFRLEGHHETIGNISAQKNARNRDADRDPHRNGGGAASLSFLPASGHELGLVFRRNEGRTYYDNGMIPADGIFDARVDFVTEQWQLFSHNRLGEGWNSKLQYGQTTDWQKNRADWAPQGSVLKTVNTHLSWQNDISLPLGKALLGFEHDTQGASPGDAFDRHSSMHGNALLLGWSARVGQHRWQISGRNDEHSRFGDKLTHALAYAYRLNTGWRLQVSLGTAFKAPSLYQLYDLWSGNPRLRPEEGRNREVALIWEDARQSASATYYLNRVENMIDWSSATYRYQNVSRARLEGVTLAHSLRFDDWSIRSSYDWLNATDEDSGLRLGRRARDRLLIAVSRRWGAFEAGAEWLGVGRRYDSHGETRPMGGYGLVNLTARYAMSDSLSIEGRINNLFDKDHELAQGYNTPGFNAFVGLRYAPR